jgi:hypothetical protein
LLPDLFFFFALFIRMSWFGGGAAASQQAMMRQLEDMQKEDSMRTFNSVVNRHKIK